MRLIDADAFDRALCNHRFTAALNEAAEAGTAFEDRELYYSTQSFRDVMKYRPTIEAVPLDKLCEWLERYATMDCDGCREAFGSCEDEENQEVSVCNSRERWKAMLTKWMEEHNATDTE